MLRAFFADLLGNLQSRELRCTDDGSLHVAVIGRRIGDPVSVSIANLAAAAVAYCPGTDWIDLGADWSPATLVVVGKFNGVLSTNEKALLECSDNSPGTVIYAGISAPVVAFAAAQLNFSAGSSDSVAQFRPSARFIRFKYINGATQQNANAVLRVVCGVPA